MVNFKKFAYRHHHTIGEGRSQDFFNGWPGCLIHKLSLDVLNLTGKNFYFRLALCSDYIDQKFLIGTNFSFRSLL